MNLLWLVINCGNGLKVNNPETVPRQVVARVYKDKTHTMTVPPETLVIAQGKTCPLADTPVFAVYTPADLSKPKHIEVSGAEMKFKFVGYDAERIGRPPASVVLLVPSSWARH
jgi:hypothetical protein